MKCVFILLHFLANLRQGVNWPEVANHVTFHLIALAIIKTLEWTYEFVLEGFDKVLAYLF